MSFLMFLETLKKKKRILHILIYNASVIIILIDGRGLRISEFNAVSTF